MLEELMLLMLATLYLLACWEVGGGEGVDNENVYLIYLIGVCV